LVGAIGLWRDLHGMPQRVAILWAIDTFFTARSGEPAQIDGLIGCGQQIFEPMVDGSTQLPAATGRRCASEIESPELWENV